MVNRRIGMHHKRGLFRVIVATAVIAATATAVSGVVRRHQSGQTERVGVADPPQPRQPLPMENHSGGITDEQLNRLERLAELHKVGALSAAEFDGQKAEILGR